VAEDELTLSGSNRATSNIAKKRTRTRYSYARIQATNLGNSSFDCERVGRGAYSAGDVQWR